MSLAIGDGDRAVLVGLALTRREMELRGEIIGFEILECAGVYLFARVVLYLECRSQTRLTIYRIGEDGAWHVVARLPSRCLPQIIDAATTTLERLDAEIRAAS